MEFKSFFWAKIPIFLIFTLFLCFAHLVNAYEGAEKWTSIGPNGGKITAIALDPQNPLTIYAGTWECGVFRSTDGGENWIQTTNGMGNQMVTSLAIDPQNPVILYASTKWTYGAGVYKSINRGESWAITGYKENAESLVIDPKNPSNLYLASWGQGVFKSSNGGESWTQINNGLGDLYLLAIAIDYQNPAILYAGTHEAGGLYKTISGGESWFKVNTGLNLTSVGYIAIDPKNSSTVYIIGDIKYITTIPVGTLYKSNSGGENCIAMPLLYSAVTISISRDADDTLYAGTISGVYRSADGGETWTSGYSGLKDPTIISLTTNPLNSSIIYAGSNVGGIFKSGNRGGSWTEKNNGLKGIRIYAIAVDPENSLTVYAGISGGVSSGGTLIKTMNGGLSWEVMANGIGNLMVFDIEVDPKNPQTVYAGGMWGFYKTINGGESWINKTGIILGWINEIAINPQNTSIIYVSAPTGLFKSSNGGESWTQIKNGLGDIVGSIEIDPQNPATIYVSAQVSGVAGTYKTTDGGESWTWFSSNQIYVDPQNSLTLYGTSQDGVYKSTDGGASWTLKKEGLPNGYIWRLTIDPKNPSTLYCVMNDGVFRSDSGAESWAPMNDGLPANEAYAIALSLHDTATIYCVTEHEGIYSTANPTESPKFALSADLSQAAAIFINKNYKLRKIDLAGHINKILTPDVNVAQFQYDHSGNLILTFYRQQLLSDGSRYILIKIDTQTNAITGIDKSLSSLSWNLSSVSPNIQLDFSGNIYYLAWTNEDKLILRRFTNDSNIVNYLNENIEISHWQVRWDGTLIIAGRNIGISTKWLRKITPDGSVSNIALPADAGWVLQLPDNQIYSGFPYQDSSGLFGIYHLSQNLTSIDKTAAQTPYIGDRQAGYNPEHDIRQLVSGHNESYCRGLTEWSGGKILNYVAGSNKNAYALLGHGAFRTILKLYPEPKVIEPQLVSQIEQIKESQNKLIIYGQKNGVYKLVVYDPSTGTETSLMNQNIKIYHLDVLPAGHIIFDGFDLTANQVVIGIYELTTYSLASAPSIQADNYTYQELARLGDETEKPLNFGAVKDRSSLPDLVAVLINSPADGAFVKSIVEIKAVALAGRGVSKVEFYIDGELKWANPSSPFIYSWNTNAYPDGLHVIKATVYDAENKIAENQISVRVCNISPGNIILNKTQLFFGATTRGETTGSQTFLITKNGGGELNWTATSSSWIQTQPTSGNDAVLVTVSVNPSGLGEGAYTGTIIIADPAAFNSPQQISVMLRVYNSESSSSPFGWFDTPEDRTSGIEGSLPVTGWALDDIEVTKVDIWRDPVGGEPVHPNGYVYIGDAVFVEGARPDVETAYPTYPLNYRAGWGYMMLTNFLPNSGNGTFRIHAIAHDKEGRSYQIGTKTITCDNAHATLPFGAIDTPAQGGIVSGNAYLNFGWALTPMPKSIPTDGLTIWLWIDGLPVGHPTYNNYRVDIATLFPGYANSQGAVGYYYLDTTKYTNGVHTIAWSVVDSAGTPCGIGSRYFTVMNTGGWSVADFGILSPFSLSLQSKDKYLSLTEELADIPTDFYSPVYVRKGYNLEVLPEPIYPDANGVINIEAQEVDRIKVALSENAASESEPDRIRGREKPARTSDHKYVGYLIVGNQLRSLPIGSFLDPGRGIFFWQPGPGFVGEYNFVFIGHGGSGIKNKKNIRVRILPTFQLKGDSGKTPVS